MKKLKGEAELRIEALEENDADDEAAEKAKEQHREEEKDKVEELKDPETGAIIHRKRRRRNVESRDAATQTDRSDYMLIKQRQQEK